MNIVLWLALFFTYEASLFDNTPQLDCKNYKVGKFTLVDTIFNGKYLIERNDSIQIERNLISGSTSKYRVTWINDCQYNLTIFEGTERIINFYKGRALTIRIVETYKDGYKFEGHLEGVDLKFTQILRRAN
jgi:hypothetical protein